MKGEWRFMFFKLVKNNYFLQNVVSKLVCSIHPSIEHNVDKIKIIKRAMFHCELEQIHGGYFEFGVYEGTSLYSAVNAHKAIGSKITRNFYGFDSFDDGFKYFDERDKHPFFKEGDFISSYTRVCKRMKKFRNVKLVKGYFENTVANKATTDVCSDDKCAILFIDCDLMGPARIALDFIRPILQNGTIIILDDYWAYKGSNCLGTRGALQSFLSENPKIKIRDYYPYGHGGHSVVVSDIS